MLENGIGIEKNLNKAFEWYKKSAENDNSEGMFSIGYAYHNGIGIDRDIEKAIYWYEKASSR